MNDPHEEFFVVCYDKEDNLIIRKVSEFMFRGRVHTNALLIGDYEAFIARDEDGKTYTNAYTVGNYYNGVYVEELQIYCMDYQKAKLFDREGLDKFLDELIIDKEREMAKLEWQMDAILDAKRNYELWEKGSISCLFRWKNQIKGH